MSRVNGRVVAGVVTLLAGIGAWLIGKKAGEKVAKATASPPPPAPPPSEDLPVVPEGGV